MDPFYASIYMIIKGFFKKPELDLEFLKIINDELDKADKKNYEIARNQAKEVYPKDYILFRDAKDCDENSMQYIERLSEYRSLLNEKSENIIFQKYKLTDKQIQEIKSNRFKKLVEQNNVIIKK